MSSVEAHWHQSLPTFPPNLSVESEVLSGPMHPDDGLVSDQEGSATAFTPPARANHPPTKAIQPSTRANEPPIGFSETQNKADKPSNEAEKQPYWANGSKRLRSIFTRFPTFTMGTKSGFYRFKNTSVGSDLYDQVSDIHDSYNTFFSVDCLISPSGFNRSLENTLQWEVIFTIMWVIF